MQILHVHLQACVLLVQLRHLSLHFPELDLLLPVEVLVDLLHRVYVLLHHLALDHVAVERVHQLLLALHQAFAHPLFVQQFHLQVPELAFAFADTPLHRQHFHVQLGERACLLLVAVAPGLAQLLLGGHHFLQGVLPVQELALDLV